MPPAGTNMSPNHRENISTLSTITHKSEYLSSTNGFLNTNSTATIAGSTLPISGATTAVGVAIVDGSGNQITSFGGGTQYLNGSTQATPTGTLALGYDGTNVRAIKTASDGTQVISGAITIGAGSAVIGHVITDSGSTTVVTSLPALPTGANTIGAISNTTFASTQSGTWTVGASSATGSAIPANAFFVGITDGTNLVGAKAMAHGLNTATGLLAAAGALEFDDVSTTTITENQFGALRGSTNRNLYTTIRDAAGNERGVNVTSNNSLQVTQRSTATGPVAVSVGATTTVILASNTARAGASIFNTSTTAIVFVSVGGTPTTSLYTVAIPAQGYFEVPAGATGAINGIVSTGTVTVNVTEYA